MRFESFRHYRDLVNSIPDIIYQIDPDGVFLFVGNAVALLGYTSDELVGRHFSEIVHPDDVPLVSRFAAGNMGAGFASPPLFDDRRAGMRTEETSEIRLIPKALSRRTGGLDPDKIVYGELSARGYYEDDEKTGKRRFLGTIGIIRDISRRKKAEGLLRKLLWAVDQTPVSIIITNADWIIEYVNPRFIRESGYTPQEIIGRNVSVLESHYHPIEFYKQMKSALLASGEWSGELVNRKKDGSYYWSSLMISAVRDPNGVVTNYISIQEDVTERKRTAEQMKSLREKEILLREIHHRVKNNLQIITSLLNLQSGTLTDERFISVFKKCENRIKTMALIHEKLYQSHDIAKIDFADYVKSLLIYLQQAHREALSRIRMTTDLASVSFGIDTAIPAGLIVNELVTNAFFHGFPDGASGEITVRVREKDHRCILEVCNTGHPIPSEKDLQSAHGLGLQLVRSLVKQLHGTLTLIRKPMTIFRVMIPRPD